MDVTGPMRRALTAVVVGMLAMAVVSPAVGDTVQRTDGDDSKGRLDLSSVRVQHRTTGVDEFRIATYGAFSNADVRPPAGNFAISIDVNDPNPTDSRWRYEYWVYAFSTANGFTGVVWDAAADRFLTGRLTVGRLSARSVRLLLPMSKIGRPDSYRFAAWSYSESSPCTSKAPCSDVVPNRLPLLLHDFTAPTATIEAPATTTDESDTLEFPATFEIDDDRFGSGVDWWKLQTREAGTSTWKTVTTGAQDGTFTRDVTGIQGSVMQTRVVVRDRSGNVTTSEAVDTVVPFDDTDPATGATFEYGPEWVAATGVAGAFLGTTHSVQAAEDATFTFTFTGTEYCMIHEPFGGVTSMVLDGEPRSFSTCRVNLDPGQHTAAVTYSGTEFVLDGLAVWP